MLPSPREVRACLDTICDPINMAIADAAMREGRGYGIENVDEGNTHSGTWMRLMYRRAGTTTARVKLSDAIRRVIMNPLEVIPAPLIGAGAGAGVGAKGVI